MSEDPYDKISKRYAEGLGKSMEDCATGFKIMAKNAQDIFDEQAEERIRAAPKKIWAEQEFRYWAVDPLDYASETELTPYIRADIVEEMREALEEVIYAERFSNRPPVTVYQAEEKLDRIKYAVTKAQTALKRLEET